MNPADTFGDTVTLEEFERMPEEEECHLELLRGRVLREPLQSAAHGYLSAELGSLIHSHAREHGLGITLGRCGFLLRTEPPTVLAPDVSFIVADTVRPSGLSDDWHKGTPDLAVEVLSFANTAPWLLAKVLEYLECGTRLVWVVEPMTRSATIYRSRQEIHLLMEGDTLDGGDLLPGLKLPLAELFAPIERS